jgi:integrase/recombinase XerD
MRDIIMERLPAKVLEPADVRRLVRHVRGQRYKERDLVLILLSFRAGLRACELARLSWPAVLTSNHRVSDQMAVSKSIAKGGSGRRIPIHPELKVALKQLHLAQGEPISGPVIRSERGAHMKPGSIVNWFRAVYAELQLAGCSSHSGRRTFITSSARVLARTGGSLRDIQELAGHRSITTTASYIEGSRESQIKLINLL